MKPHWDMTIDMRRNALRLLRPTRASPMVQQLVINGAQVGADLLSFNAPVLLTEKWVIAPSVMTTPGLVIRSNVWNTGSKFTNSANILLDTFGF